MSITNLIRQQISSQGTFQIPMLAGQFEAALRSQIFSSQDQDPALPNPAFDKSAVPQKYYGQVGNGQFRLRCSNKIQKKGLPFFFVEGSYASQAGGTQVKYELSPNGLRFKPAIIFYSIFLVVGFIISLKVLPPMAAFGNILGAIAFVVLMIVMAFKPHLKPAAAEFEEDMKSLENVGVAELENGSAGLRPALVLATPERPRQNVAGFIFLAIFGLAFFSVACLFGYLHYQDVRQKTEAVAAKVIEMEERKGGKRNQSTLYAPIVEYTAKDGNQYVYHSNTASSPPEYAVGETVTVYYDPKNPAEARMDSFLFWLIPLVFSIVGGAIMIWSIASLRSMLKKAPVERDGAIVRY